MRDSYSDEMRAIHQSMAGKDGVAAMLLDVTEAEEEEWQRREAEQGQKHDAGKARMDLIPPHMELELAKVLAHGAAKYSAENWRMVAGPRARYIAAAKRHINAMARGEAVDEESGLHHAAHAVACLMFVGELEIEVKGAGA